MTRSKPHRWLWLTLAATLLATGWLALNAPQEGPLEVVTARVTETAPGSPGSNSGAIQAADWPRRVTRAPAQAWPRLAPAAATSWGVPAPPPPPPKVVASAPPPPAPPQAPPFPYQLIGRLEGADGHRALMTNDVRTVAVAVGAVVDGQWRIDKLDRSSMSVTWLPGEQALSVAYGTSK